MVIVKNVGNYEAAESTEELLSSEDKEAISVSMVFDRRREDASAIWYCWCVCWNIILIEPC